MIAFQQDVPLADFTTIRLGGKARYFVVCQTLDELVAALSVAAEYGMPVHILGGGSNTIFRDEGFDGLVVKVAVQGIQLIKQDNDVQVQIAAGEEWDAFVRFCIARGLAGVECLSGIPGLVGAAPMQNIGAYGQEVAETIVEVQALRRRTREKLCFSNSMCNFGYRRSRFNTDDAHEFVITQVTFRLRSDGQPRLVYPELQRYIEANVPLSELEAGVQQLAAVREAVLALRKKKSMLIDPDDPNARSVGSFFKNPILSRARVEDLQARCRALGIAEPVPTFPFGHDVKVPAAWLVEKAGFTRGFRKGGVGVSSNHALALVNYNGTARALLALAAEIEAAVAARFGVRLEREPVVVP